MADARTNEPPAFFVLRHAAQPHSERWIPIEANSEFDIGRQDIFAAFGSIERTISTHHLRVRCVIYEGQDVPQVAPLVYVRVLSSNNISLYYRNFGEIGEDIILRAIDGDVLLSHGDCLRLSSSFSLVLETSESFRVKPPEFDDTFHSEVARISEEYVVHERLLGAGGFASVVLALNKTTCKQVACKIIPLPSLNPNHGPLKFRQSTAEQKAASREFQLKLLRKRQIVAREYNLLKTLDHPNIVSLEKVFCAPYHTYIFQELITGGDLLSYLDRKGALLEPEAAVIARQIVQAVAYLHDRLIVHRDLKPENVLMTSWREGARVVLTDFGQSRMVVDSQLSADRTGPLRMHSTVGTYGYTAPEVYFRDDQSSQEGEGYSQAIDMWSVGCIIATLLTNQFVFPNDAEYHRVNDIHLYYGERLKLLGAAEEWKRVSRNAKAFVSACLELDEHSRITATQGLQHAWFTNRHYSTALDEAYLRAIQDWKPRGHEEAPIQTLGTSEIVGLRGSRTADQRSGRSTPLLPPLLPIRSRLHSPIRETLLPAARRARSHTPLSPIGPSSPSGHDARSNHVAASPVRPARRLQTVTRPNHSTRNSLASFSIENFAPPAHHLPMHPAHTASVVLGSPTPELQVATKETRGWSQSSLSMDDVEELERKLHLITGEIS